MVIPIDAVDKEDFDRAERGLPPRPKAKVIRKEPEFPQINNRIEFAKLDLKKVVRIEAIRKNVLKNKDGARFIGFDIIIEISDGKPLEGWMMEGDLFSLLPFVREKTDQVILQNVHY